MKYILKKTEKSFWSPEEVSAYDKQSVRTYFKAGHFLASIRRTTRFDNTVETDISIKQPNDSKEQTFQGLFISFELAKEIIESTFQNLFKKSYRIDPFDTLEQVLDIDFSSYRNTQDTYDNSCILFGDFRADVYLNHEDDKKIETSIKCKEELLYKNIVTFGEEKCKDMLIPILIGHFCETFGFEIVGKEVSDDLVGSASMYKKGCAQYECKHRGVNSYEYHNRSVEEAFLLMPNKLTAENGMKSLLRGEFKVTDPSYSDGVRELYIPWDTIKDIYKKIVEYWQSEPINNRPGFSQDIDKNFNEKASEVSADLFFTKLSHETFKAVDNKDQVAKSKDDLFYEKRAAMSNEKLIEEVSRAISNLCKNPNKFTMSIPPSIYDYDMLFTEMLDRFRKAIAVSSKNLTSEEQVIESNGILPIGAKVISTLTDHPLYPFSKERKKGYSIRQALFARQIAWLFVHP